MPCEAVSEAPEKPHEAALSASERLREDVSDASEVLWGKASDATEALRETMSEAAERLLRALAASSPNDAVRLLFLKEEDISVLGGLDLSLLTEMKRSANGAVELKLLSRLEIIKALHELERTRETEVGGANFYAALDKAAGSLEARRNDEV